MEHLPDIPPRITIASVDFDRLSNLAQSAQRGAPDAVAFLLEELGRATIAPQPLDETVRMGSCVYFRGTGNDMVQRVRLVYPGESDARRGHISVLTPVGTTLIGLSAGQTMTWRDRRGGVKALTVLAVQNESASAPFSA